MNYKLIAAMAAALCVALSLGAGAAAAHRNSSAYVCAYGKKAGKAGNIYLALGITPKSIGKSFCQSFNNSFKGRAENVHSQLGDGKTYCRYRYKRGTVDVVALAFADKAPAGKAFCKIFHPKGWKKF